LKRFPLTVLFCAVTVFSFAMPKIKQILVDGKPMDLKRNIFLSASKNDIVFDFENPDSDSSIFYYRLIQLSEKWTQSTYPSAHYQNLSGGKYTFQIFEQNTKYKLKIYTLTFEVKEAFWQKSWFWPSIIIYILMVLGIGIYLFSLYNFRQKLKMQYVRNQIASDLHDEVGSNLNSIAIFVELLKKKMPNAQPELMSLLGKITDNSEESVSLMRDTVWAINPDNDNTAKLLEKMESFGIEMLSSKGIAFSFENQLDAKKNEFQMEQRRNVYMMQLPPKLLAVCSAKTAIAMLK
jgi:Histidine kinase